MTKDEMIKIVNDSISKLKNKDFKVLFYVLDTKGNPSGSLEYIYQTAMVLHRMGYNVGMLHQEEEFVGVGEWLGREYSELPHYNVTNENVEIGPSDFLFIPEIFANVMSSTKKLPCKRIIIIQNCDNICEFMPLNETPVTFGITDAVVTTEKQINKINEYFPDLRCHLVHPSIKKMFRNNDFPKKLTVNILTKDQTVFNRIIKPFYWKSPYYRWISFKDLRGLPIDVFCNTLIDSAISIWVDDDTKFGYTLLESLRCGNIVLAKIPTHPSEWMLDEDGNLKNTILWFNDLDEIPDLLSSVIRSWTLDLIPDEIYEKQDSFSNMFTEDEQTNEIFNVYVKGFFEKRLNDFIEVLADVENNLLKVD